MNIIAWIFPNWRVIEVHHYRFGVTYLYEILYSVRRNDFKIKCYGKDAKTYPKYGEVVERVEVLRGRTTLWEYSRKKLRNKDIWFN